MDTDCAARHHDGEATPRIHSFPPVVGDSPRVLILGSMPSVESLARGQYYAHPRNYFWPLIAAVVGAALPATYAQRLSMLTRHHIALWDSVESCVRAGSLDGDIREERPNDIHALVAAHPTIQAIGFNGAKALSSYRRHNHPLPGITCVSLPSSSPIPTRTMSSLNDRLERWIVIRDYL